jgi:hypothetical protein
MACCVFFLSIVDNAGPLAPLRSGRDDKVKGNCHPANLLSWDVKLARWGSWYPTSREKRARCGPPVIGGRGQVQSGSTVALFLFTFA